MGFTFNLTLSKLIKINSNQILLIVSNCAGTLPFLCKTEAKQSQVLRKYFLLEIIQFVGCKFNEEIAVVLKIYKFKNKMNPHKKQSIQKLVIEQSGSQTLDLNDIVLGYEGARVVGALIPQYHKNIRHINLNGNNIDAEGFEIILTGLLHCMYLKSIHAEWNQIGSSEVGLAALCSLVDNSQFLEFIDLKNNRISHHLARFIADILEMNKKNLKVIDLRWNDLGELGAKQILAVLALNKNVKFIGLEDNRISMGTLMEIESLLKGNGTYIGKQQPRLLKHSHSQPNSFAQQYFPISADSYPSMDVQLKTGQIRSKIENEQKQANRYTEKVQVEIQKVIQKIKLKGAQISEIQLKHDALMAENAKITSQLREAERMLALEKQRTIGYSTKNSEQKSQMRNQKYKLNGKIQSIMQKYTQRNQRQLDEIQLVMGQKLDRLNTYLKERLFQKRANRQKLAELKEDIFKLRVNKEQITNRQTQGKNLHAIKSTCDQQIFIIQEEIANVEMTLKNEMKKGQYMSKELNSQVMKALTKEQNLEKQIFNVQNKIKGIHHGMAIKNLELEKNLAELRLKQSEIYDKQATIDMENKYLKYMHSEGNVKFQVEALIEQELLKGDQKTQEGVESRIAEVERALRAQQAQNRMIKNQYQKLMSQLENITKKNIQLVLFE